MSSPKDKPSPSSTSEQASQPPSSVLGAVMSSEQLALPLTASERAESWTQLSKLHPGNRFRLMFGLPLLDEASEQEKSP